MKKILCLFLVLMVIGQLKEIKEQNVRFGEYIEQYAIVERVLQSGNSYYDKCISCNATLTVKDSSGKILINNQYMTELSRGHFGYLAKASELQTGKVYFTFFNISSSNVSLGSDILDGKLTVLSESNTNTNTENTINTESSWTIKDLSTYDFNAEPYKESAQCSNLIGGLFDTSIPDLISYLYCQFNSYLLYPLYNLLIDMKLIQIFKVFGYIYLSFLHILLFIIGFVLNLFGIVIDFYNNPTVYFFETVIPFLITVFSGILLAFFLFIMFIECGIIGYAYLKNGNGDILGILSETFKANFMVIWFFVGVIYTAIMGLIQIIIAIFTMIGSLNPLGK